MGLSPWRWRGWGEAGLCKGRFMKVPILQAGRLRPEGQSSLEWWHSTPPSSPWGPQEVGPAHPFPSRSLTHRQEVSHQWRKPGSGGPAGATVPHLMSAAEAQLCPKYCSLAHSLGLTHVLCSRSSGALPTPGPVLGAANKLTGLLPPLTSSGHAGRWGACCEGLYGGSGTNGTERASPCLRQGLEEGAGKNIPSEWKSQCKVSEAGEKAGEPPWTCGEWEGRGVGAPHGRCFSTGSRLHPKSCGSH